ncbi:MAG: hypothetical protein D6812_11860 [Deltaproteobacteria bacterium]|nr:MAG: hypothetical protein D6812_11860 [Deltaproteobacteria bacterium]
MTPKLQRLLQYAREAKKPCLAFVERRQDAEIAAKLYGPGAAAVHGGRSEEEREEVLQGLKAGKYEVAFCTKIWATGIDIPEIQSVVVGRTRSKIQRVQRAGRALRVDSGKEFCEVWGQSGLSDTAVEEADEDGYARLWEAVKDDPIVQEIMRGPQTREAKWRLRARVKELGYGEQLRELEGGVPARELIRLVATIVLGVFIAWLYLH